MLTAVTNQTRPLVELEIDNMLAYQSDERRRMIFGFRDMRLKLEAYVLSRIPCRYEAIEWEDGDQPLQPTGLSLNDKWMVHKMIREGMDHLLEAEGDWIKHHIPPTEEEVRMPSRWFG